MFGNIFIYSVTFLCLVNGFLATNDFDRNEEVPEKDESNWKEAVELIREPFIALLVELKEPVIEDVKNLFADENEITLSSHEIVLATFDGKGLLNAITYNETKFFEKIENISSSESRKSISPPTLKALNDLITNKNLSDGNIVLVTSSRPSDDYVYDVKKLLTRKNCQLSVIWAENENLNDGEGLKEISKESKGKFITISNDIEMQRQSLELLPSVVENFVNVSQNVRFPEEEKKEEKKLDINLLGARTLNQKNIGLLSVPLIVEVASGTSLEIQPGQHAQISFNVKNTMNVPAQVFFSAKLNSIFLPVQPPSAQLQPFASMIATVNIPAAFEGESNSIGTLTLVASTRNVHIARSATIHTTTQTTKDNIDPKMTYKYDGDCSNFKEPKNCENGNWGIQATFHDEETGLLKILSEPYGLLFNSEFVAGTKSPVSVHYSATCCQPKVDIWAEDTRGNYVRKSFDVFNQNLLAGEIAAIVVGALLILLIIIAIIVSVVLYRRRKTRRSMLP